MWARPITKSQLTSNQKMEAFIGAAGATVRYALGGVGERLVVLLHGYGESLDVWDDLAGVLGKRYRVLRVDLPGSGVSDWGDRSVLDTDFMASVVAGVMDKLEWEQAVVVGHSMGGYVATALGALFPQKVGRLALLHSTPEADSPERRAQRDREITLVEQGKKELLVSMNVGRSFAPQNRKRCEEVIDELGEQLMLTPPEALVATLKGMNDRTDHSAWFAGAPIPRLMIFGRFDWYIPQEAAEAMIEKYATAHHAWLEESGHMGFVEERDKVVGLLENFIAE